MKKEKLQQLAHLLAGILIFFQVFNWLENRNISTALIFFSIGLLFLLVAALHKWVQKNFENGDAPVFLLEAVSFFYCAWSMLEAGRKFLTIVYAGLVFVYIAGAVITFIMDRDTTHRSSRRRGRRKKYRSKRNPSTVG